MIRLSRLNGKEFVVNCELIKFVESTPDTVITLTTGEKLMVREGVDQVVAETVRYKQGLFERLAPEARPGQGTAPKGASECAAPERERY